MERRSSTHHPFEISYKILSGKPCSGGQCVDVNVEVCKLKSNFFTRRKRLLWNLVIGISVIKMILRLKNEYKFIWILTKIENLIYPKSIKYATKNRTKKLLRLERFKSKNAHLCRSLINQSHNCSYETSFLFATKRSKINFSTLRFNIFPTYKHMSIWPEAHNNSTFHPRSRTNTKENR